MGPADWCWEFECIFMTNKKHAKHYGDESSEARAEFVDSEFNRTLWEYSISYGTRSRYLWTGFQARTTEPLWQVDSAKS